MNFTSGNFDNLYKKLAGYILKNGEEIVVNKKRTIECTNCSIMLSNPNNDKINFTDTKLYKRQKQYDSYYEEEIQWYESGCLVAKHAPASLWSKIADVNGKIQSNYGHLILYEKKPYKKEMISSYENALELLQKDNFSRQAILHYNLPIHYSSTSKDIPCTVCTQVLIRHNELNFIVFQRSSDLYLGLPYDVHWHCYLLKKFSHDLSKKIGREVSEGSLTMIFGSLHIYLKDKDNIKKFLQKRN